MYQNLQKEIQKQLQENERIIWTGQPKQGIVFRKSDRFLIPFGVLWCGFVILWFVLALQDGPTSFAMFGLPFVIIGLFFVFGRFIVDSKLRSNTYYGITNERIIIRSGLITKKTTSINFSKLLILELEEHSNNEGNIFFGNRSPMGKHAAGMNWIPGWHDCPQFELIKNANEVYKQILSLQKY